MLAILVKSSKSRPDHAQPDSPVGSAVSGRDVSKPLAYAVGISFGPSGSAARVISPARCSRHSEHPASAHSKMAQGYTSPASRSARSVCSVQSLSSARDLLRYRRACETIAKVRASTSERSDTGRLFLRGLTEMLAVTTADTHPPFGRASGRSRLLRGRNGRWDRRSFANRIRAPRCSSFPCKYAGNGPRNDSGEQR